MSYLKQADTPLYEDIFWSRPERADVAGSMLIIGGNRDSLKSPMTAFGSAQNAGVGSVTVLLPDSVKKQLGRVEGVDYLPSTSSGGFAKNSLQEVLARSAHVGTVLLSGDFARSSETTQLLEELLLKLICPVIVTHDGLDSLLNQTEVYNQEKNLLVFNPGQFQRFMSALGSKQAYRADMPLDAFAELITMNEQAIRARFITLHSGHVWVFDNGDISATRREDIDNEHIWQVEQAARSGVFLLQHPEESFQSLTSSVFR